jgi:hypothetical protein
MDCFAGSVASIVIGPARLRLPPQVGTLGVGPDVSGDLAPQLNGAALTWDATGMPPHGGVTAAETRRRRPLCSRRHRLGNSACHRRGASGIGISAGLGRQHQPVPDPQLGCCHRHNRAHDLVSKQHLPAAARTPRTVLAVAPRGVLRVRPAHHRPRRAPARDAGRRRPHGRQRHHIAIAWSVAILTVGYMLPWAVAATRQKSNSVAIGPSSPGGPSSAGSSPR